MHAGGKGLGGVAVTDGLQVVATENDGRYELITDLSRRFVSLSVPAGYALPTHATGTTRCFHRIAPGANGSMEAQFPLTPLSVEDGRHAFLLLADIQTQNIPDMTRFRQETVPDLKKTVS